MEVEKSVVAAVGFMKNGRTTKPADLLGDERSITLEPDPSNVFDPHAVKVLLDGVHAAFVSRKDTRDAEDVLAFQRPYTVKALQAFDASAILLITVPPH